MLKDLFKKAIKGGMGSIKKISKIDAFIMALFALLAIFAVTALNNPDFIFSFLSIRNHKDLEKMGEIFSLQNDVRKKMINETHWTPLKTEGDVFDSQMIFTSGDSHATVRLGDSELIIEPESLVLFLKEGARPTLELKSGGLSGSFKNIEVAHKGKKLKINSKSSQIKIKEEGVKIVHQDKEARVHAPEVSLIEKEDFVNKIIELEPLESVYYIVGAKPLSLELKWSSESIKNFGLKVIKTGVKNKSFLSLKSVASQGYTLKVKEPGSYLVSVSEAFSESATGGEAAFEVIHLPELKLVRPVIKKQL